MPRYYCDYCDTYLTHDSPSVRKQHGAGYKHKANVRTYYQQFEEQQTQSLIDQRIKEHLGQTAAFQQVGAAYTQHFSSFPQRPPILPTPGLPPGVRPPVLPRPIGAPGYGFAPPMQTMLAPPGAPSLPMQFNGLARPPTMNAPPTVSAGTSNPTSNGNPSMTTPGVYQANPTAPITGGFDSYNTNATPDTQSATPASQIEH